MPITPNHLPELHMGPIRGEAPTALAPMAALTDSINHLVYHDPILHFKLDPGFEPYGQPLNSLGLRGPVPGPRREGTLRMVALGDSCTFGYIGRDEGVGEVFQPYPLKLQRFAGPSTS